MAVATAGTAGRTAEPGARAAAARVAAARVALAVLTEVATACNL